MIGRNLTSCGKPLPISKRMVWKAYLEVRGKGKAAGVDHQSLDEFERNLEDNLYRLWNRMASGSYFPPPVRRVKIPKGNGGKRPLGISTVPDRIAQMVVKQFLETDLDAHFDPDSYGYHPGKSAHDAVGRARERCWRRNWVLDFDIRAFFDSIDHDLVMKALRKYTQERWVSLYAQRWLKAPAQLPDGRLEARSAGTQQGGIISPLLVNLFFALFKLFKYLDERLAHYLRRKHRDLWGHRGESLRRLDQIAKRNSGWLVHWQKFGRAMVG